PEAAPNRRGRTEAVGEIDELLALNDLERVGEGVFRRAGGRRGGQTEADGQGKTCECHLDPPVAEIVMGASLTFTSSGESRMTGVQSRMTGFRLRTAGALSCVTEFQPRTTGALACTTEF